MIVASSKALKFSGDSEVIEHGKNIVVGNWIKRCCSHMLCVEATPTLAVDNDRRRSAVTTKILAMY